MEEADINETQISKKELLQQYGISYGALYRWKRMGLIPEEWFCKKATATGQETFFPRALVCERIELIQSRKDTGSLEALAAELSGRAKREASLTVVTSYGTTQYRLCDLQQLLFTDEQGTITDLTPQLPMPANQKERNPS